MEPRDKNGLTQAEFLAQYRQKDYPRPSFTADVVALSGTANAAATFARDGMCSLRVLLIQRGGHPYLGCWAFPGGFVNQDEDADSAAARERAEETGIVGLSAVQLGSYSKPGRDPRGWTISAAYLACVDVDVAAQAGDDAARALWCDTCVQRCDDGLIEVRVAAEGESPLCVFATHDDSRNADRTKVISCEGFAFDHADMFADALARVLCLERLHQASNVFSALQT